MKKLATEPMALAPADFDRFIGAEIESNAAVVRAAGMQPN
jgi:tripartite-type tricarboxylate transporter receptor subunit TctC